MRFFDGTVLLSGEFATSKLAKVLNLLDGTNTIERVYDEVGIGYQPELDHLLQVLGSKGLIWGQTSKVAVASPCTQSHERAYWALVGPNESVPLERLQASVALIVGLGGIGYGLSKTLAAAGVGKIIGVDPTCVREGDESLGYDKDEIGKPRAEIAASRINDMRRGLFVPFVGKVDDSECTANLVKEADLVVITNDNMSLGAYDLINELSLRFSTPWVSARVDRNRGIIGPFVVPGQTACFTCYELRNRANSEHPADHDALYQFWKGSDLFPDDWPVLPPFLNLIGSYLALDILRVFGRRDLSAFIGRVLYIDSQSLISTAHPVLKLPRCPACSRCRYRPLTKIWDV